MLWDSEPQDWDWYAHDCDQESRDAVEAVARHAHRLTMEVVK